MHIYGKYQKVMKYIVSQKVHYMLGLSDLQTSKQHVVMNVMLVFVTKFPYRIPKAVNIKQIAPNLRSGSHKRQFYVLLVCVQKLTSIKVIYVIQTAFQEVKKRMVIMNPCERFYFSENFHTLVNSSHFNTCKSDFNTTLYLTKRSHFCVAAAANPKQFLFESVNKFENLMKQSLLTVG